MCDGRWDRGSVGHVGPGSSLSSLMTGFFLYIISRGCVMGGGIGGVSVLATHSHPVVSNDTSNQKRHMT